MFFIIIGLIAAAVASFMLLYALVRMAVRDGRNDSLRMERRNKDGERYTLDKPEKDDAKMLAIIAAIIAFVAGVAIGGGVAYQQHQELKSKYSYSSYYDRD